MKYKEFTYSYEMAEILKNLSVIMSIINTNNQFTIKHLKNRGATSAPLVTLYEKCYPQYRLS